MNDSEVVIARLKTVFSVTSDSSLCEQLGVSPQTLSSWKSRNKIPYANCVEISKARGVSLDWLLTGRGSVEISNSDICSAQIYPDLAITERERKWLELFNNLSPEAQKNILQDIEKEQRLAELEQELKGLKDYVKDIKRTG